MQCFIKRVKIEPHFLLSPMMTRAGAVLALQGYQAISDLSTGTIARVEVGTGIKHAHANKYSAEFNKKWVPINENDNPSPPQIVKPK